MNTNDQDFNERLQLNEPAVDCRIATVLLKYPAYRTTIAIWIIFIRSSIDRTPFISL